MKKTHLFIVPLVVFGTFLVIKPVSAHMHGGTSSEKAEKRKEAMQTKKAEIEAKKEEMLEKKEEKMEKRCEKVGERVAAKIAKYEENKDTHVENYNKIVTRLEDISSKLEEKGFDVSELEGAIETWKGKVSDFEDAYTDFIAELETSEDYVCGESEGAYKKALTQAREQYKNAIQLRQQAKKYYADEIREAIKGLREQAKKMRVENSELEE